MTDATGTQAGSRLELCPTRRLHLQSVRCRPVCKAPPDSQESSASLTQLMIGPWIGCIRWAPGHRQLLPHEARLLEWLQGALKRLRAIRWFAMGEPLKQGARLALGLLRLWCVALLGTRGFGFGKGSRAKGQERRSLCWEIWFSFLFLHLHSFIGHSWFFHLWTRPPILVGSFISFISSI